MKFLFKPKQREVITFCKSCGATASLFTTTKKVSEKEKTFECNKCVVKRWKKERKTPKLKQGVFV